ncbi:MAG: hypothetical protein KDC44_14975, partial [Phaeodactylibacter sp.]|nr:hypothetical protein [Phaeodactylibacter sp.]
MKCRYRFYVILILGCCRSVIPDGLHAQSRELLPQLRVAEAHRYNLGNESPSDCVAEAMIDQAGRCWVASCGVNELAFQVRLMRFDGYKFHPVNLANQQLLSTYSSRFQGFDREGRLVGFLNSTADTSYFFRFDPDREETYLLPLVKEAFPASTGMAYLEMEDTALLMLGYQDAFELYQLAGDRLQLWHRIPVADTARVTHWRKYAADLLNYRNDIWITHSELPLTRMSKTGAVLKTYPEVQMNRIPEVYDPEAIVLCPRLEACGEELLLFAPGSTDGFYVYRSQADRFEPLEFVPEGRIAKG